MPLFLTMSLQFGLPQDHGSITYHNLIYTAFLLSLQAVFHHVTRYFLPRKTDGRDAQVYTLLIQEMPVSV